MASELHGKPLPEQDKVGNCCLCSFYGKTVVLSTTPHAGGLKHQQCRVAVVDALEVCTPRMPLCARFPRDIVS
eukprot:5821102-Amphidinium_carterae.1